MEILISLLFIAFLTLAPTTNASAPILINCGLPKSKTTASWDKRTWQSDDGAAFSPPDLNSFSSAATASSGSTIDAPFAHARIFGPTNSTYSFTLSPGPKFIRLYFYTSPTITYNNISASQSFISLTANEFTLFTNFSADLNSEFMNSYSHGLFVEFYVPVFSTVLKLTFYSPENNGGFVNAIEIVSVPDGLYLNNSGSQPLYPNYANSLNANYTVQETTSFQTAYRLIAGATDVQATSDVDRLGRTWYNDEEYIYGGFYGATTYPTYHIIDDNSIKFSKISPDAAPKIVYLSQRMMWKNASDIKMNTNMNLTWMFWVDPGFNYLLRLHLCENSKVVSQGVQRQFHVWINNIVADNTIDVFDISGELGSPIYLDYIFYMHAAEEHGGDSGQINATTGKAQMLFSLVPDTIAPMKDVLLNGLEILKLDQSNGSLVAPNPSLSIISTTPIVGKDSNTNGSKHTLAIIGGVIGGVVLVILVLAVLFLRRQRSNAMIPLPSDDTDKSKKNSWVPITSLVSGSAGTNTTVGSALPSDLCRRFSLAQIKVATSDFNESFIVGTGGFGKVYRGKIDGGATTVAIKRLTSTSKQGVNEFRTEIEMLSRLRHLHLVSLIGYCEDQGEMILVYEYMPRGTLRDHLMYRSSGISSIEKPLSWKQRLMICVGSARGLHYLHSGTKDLIIHRDVKSTNILLDDKWTAKVSDFGLSKVGPTSESGIGHVSTAVKGSFGYLDPEYIKRHRLTDKSDVYSFGVVLFEVLCARPAVKPNVPKEQVNLAKWARSCYLSGTLQTIVDPNLAGQIAPESLNKFGEIAEMCVRDEGNQRPMIGDVVWALEFTLQLQETAEKNNTDSPLQEFALKGGDGGTTDEDMFSVTVDSGTTEAMTMDKSTSNTSESSHHMGIKSGSIFSEIMDPQAR